MHAANNNAPTSSQQPQHAPNNNLFDLIPSTRPTSLSASSTAPRTTSAPAAAAAAPHPSTNSNIDLLSFFDPLSNKQPAAPASVAPASTQAIQPVNTSTGTSGAVDPFNDPFATTNPTNDGKAQGVKRASGGKSHPVAAANEKRDGSKSSSSSSDSDSDSSSDEESESESDSDDGVRPDKKTKTKAKSPRKWSQHGALAKDPGSTVSHTSNQSLTAPGRAAANTAAAKAVSSAVPLIQVDVLEFMHKGCPLLKYGKSGFPHFRHFQLMDDNLTLVWFSGNKKLSETRVSLTDVIELRLGQHTPTFARHPAPDLAQSSFSLIYDQGRSSLDVIAKDPNEFRCFTGGLRQLLRILEEDGPAAVERLNQLTLPLPIIRERRSSFDITDAKTGKPAALSADADGDFTPTSRPRALSTTNKDMHQSVWKAFMKLKRSLEKRRDELKSIELYTSPQYDTMQHIIKRVENSCARITQDYNDGEYAAADDECWRASVDLEALKAMMQACRTRIRI